MTRCSGRCTLAGGRPSQKVPPPPGPRKGGAEAGKSSKAPPSERSRVLFPPRERLTLPGHSVTCLPRNPLPALTLVPFHRGER